jgi:hypothetical protein
MYKIETKTKEVKYCTLLVPRLIITQASTEKLAQFKRHLGFHFDAQNSKHSTNEIMQRSTVINKKSLNFVLVFGFCNFNFFKICRMSFTIKKRK